MTDVLSADQGFMKEEAIESHKIDNLNRGGRKKHVASKKHKKSVEHVQIMA